MPAHIRKHLRNYQIEGGLWLANAPTRGRILADPPGFGKTCSAIYGAQFLMQTAPVTEMVIPIFCPAMARTDWLREATDFWPGAKVTLVGWNEPTYQKAKESDEAFWARKDANILTALRSQGQPHLLVASYEQAERLLALMERERSLFALTILDEAHYLKKDTTLRNKTVRPIIAKSSHAFLLTGTPIHNKPEDLYQLLDICALGKFGNSKWHLARKYFQIQQSIHGMSIGNVIDKQGLRDAVAPYILCRSVAEAYGELPARIRTLKPIEAPIGCPLLRLSPARLAAMGRGNIGEIERVLRESAALKIDAAVQLAKELAEPVVLYAYTRDDASALCRALNAAGVPSLLATGDTVAKDRAELIEQWKQGKATGLVCTMDAVRESATLVRASAMIFIDLDWLPGKQVQCEGRIDPSRQPEGERRPARYYYIVLSGGPDEVIAQRVLEKIANAQGIISMDENMAGLAGTLQGASVTLPSTTEMITDLGNALIEHAKRLASLNAELGLGGSVEEHDTSYRDL